MSAPVIILGVTGSIAAYKAADIASQLVKGGAEVHVVKNSVFSVAAKEAGIAELNGSMAGQLAVVTGKKDISSAAKAVKNFAAEFDKLKLKFGYLNNQRLDEASILALADLPSLDVLRAKLLGLFNAPATKLATLINTPAVQLAQVIKAKSEKAA